MLIKGLISFVSSFILIVTVYANSSHSLKTISNIELAALKEATLIGPIDPQQAITFTVWLKLKNEEQLASLISDLYNPKSRNYQKFLSSKQFNQRFAPDKKTVEAVSNYFKEQGMQVKQTYNNLHITARAEQIEVIFHLKMNNYRYQNHQVYGNDRPPVLNRHIASYISSISELSNIPYTHHKMRSITKNSKLKNWQSQDINLQWDSFLPAVVPTTTSLQGFNGSQLRTTYNVANIAPINGTTIDGSGQTIVIIDGCDHATETSIKNYANQYSQANGLPLLSTSNFAVVKHDGSPYTGHCSNPGSWDGEIMLDVQASHTIAPGANIVVVLTDNVINSQVADAINYITSHNFTIGGFSNAYVVSNSWDNNYDNAHEALDVTLAAAAAQGLTLNFAAGDCGDQTYNSNWPCSILSATPSVQYPATSAYVTSVSGTSVFVDNNWNYAFETGWGSLVNGAFNSGSMGGISQYRDSPSWQSSISGFTAGGYNDGTVGYYNKRALPDIAMLADLYTGLNIYSDGCNPCQYGGASLATPLFSGTMTLVNQARSLLANGTPNPIGLASPYFYINNLNLIKAKALNLITPPHGVISGATPVNGGPNSAFKIYDSFFSEDITFNWDSSLTIIENQFWNDVVGVGSPNIPNFVQLMANI